MITNETTNHQKHKDKRGINTSYYTTYNKEQYHFHIDPIESHSILENGKKIKEKTNILTYA